MSSYIKKRNALVRKFEEILNKNGDVGLGKKTSNLFRHRESEKQKIDVTNFNHVIKIDTKKRICEVEAMITYEALISETLKYGFLPTVVPQLKSITIGGALAGMGIESSSFKYGLVHETVEEIDVLTPEMKVFKCNKKENRDLFYGFPNSYGTLGYALKIKVKIIPVKKYVKISHLKFNNFHDYFNAINKHSKLNYDFIDGVIFNKKEMYLTLVKMVDESPYVSDYTHMQIYFKSIRNKKEDFLTLKDYIWRWDTDWFWCSKNFFVQNPLIRFFWGKKRLNSEIYQKIRIKVSKYPFISKIIKKWKTESVIQDVEIPIKNSQSFADFFCKNIGINPIWVCPTKIYNQNSIFPLYIMKPGILYINFGFWDIIKSNKFENYYNKLIEKKVSLLGGKKSLYSSSFYTKKEFWRLYNKKAYDKLKKKYDPKKRFKDLYEKCVLRQ